MQVGDAPAIAWVNKTKTFSLFCARKLFCTHVRGVGAVRCAMRPSFSVSLPSSLFSRRAVCKKLKISKVFFLTELRKENVKISNTIVYGIIELLANQTMGSRSREESPPYSTPFGLRGLFRMYVFIRPQTHTVHTYCENKTMTIPNV